MVVEGKKESIAGVMKDFQVKGERQVEMEGFVPWATVLFVEATPELFAANIPRHTLTPYFAIQTVEEWAANSTAAHEFSYVWLSGWVAIANCPALGVVFHAISSCLRQFSGGVCMRVCVCVCDLYF